MKDGKTLRTAKVGLAFSDRMITAGDVQYQPDQQKVAHMGNRTLLMIAGDFSMHSHAIRETQRKMANMGAVAPYTIALMYGQEIQAIKRKQAEDIFLAPLGLNTDTFLAQQKEMSVDFVNHLTSQLQNYQSPDVEALIVGSDDENAHIYLVDAHGTSHCMDDVGFAAIGIGAWHAKSRLMQAGYTNTSLYARAVSVAFAAKKAAEIAPGVGTYTDINMVFTSGIEPLYPAVAQRIHGLHDEYLAKLHDLGREWIEKLNDELPSFVEKKKEHAESKGSTGGHAQADAGSAQNATEAARGNEAPKKSKWAED